MFPGIKSVVDGNDELVNTWNVKNVLYVLILALWKQINDLVILTDKSSIFAFFLKVIIIKKIQSYV